MKIEQKQLLVFMGKILCLLTFAALYAIGGSGDFFGGQLWIRRWLAPFILMTGAFLFSFDWRFLVAYPLMGAAMCLPYGADTTWEKILLRGLFGLACAIAFNLPYALRKQWLWLMLGCILSILGSIYLGVLNPAPDAITEQGFIALLIGATYILGAKRKETK